MSDIKMSDVFELPVVVADIVIFGGRVTWEGSSSDYDEAAATAINAYDANQERIANLELIIGSLKDCANRYCDGDYIDDLNREMKETIEELS
jgi:hypothetical protein